jgi:hypothetical protein
MVRERRRRSGGLQQRAYFLGANFNCLRNKHRAATFGSAFRRAKDEATAPFHFNPLI